MGLERYIDAELETPIPPYWVAVCGHDTCRRQITSGATACSYHPFAGIIQYDVVTMRRSHPADKVRG